jgi:hypothetical protein
MLVEDVEIGDLLQRCNMLAVQAKQVLRGPALRTGLVLVFAVVCYLFAVLERRAEPGLVSPDAAETERWEAERTRRKLAAVAVAERMLKRVTDFLEQSAQRVAQMRYFLGMALGTLLLVTVALLTLAVPNVAFSTFDISPDAYWTEGVPIITCVVAGGIGAAVSVMSRMTSGKLVLDPNVSTRLSLILGGGRVLLGTVFGVAMYFLVRGTILPLKVPEAPATFFFYASLAFIAGFSERFAQDALDLSGRQLFGSSNAERTRGSGDVFVVTTAETRSSAPVQTVGGGGRDAAPPGGNGTVPRPGT